MSLEYKKQQHIDFWNGDGSSLIFIPTAQMCQYDVDDYESRFNNPDKMLEAELSRAKAVIDWPTDGIPTVRPNLGTVFIPAIAGQSYSITDGQMPWPGEYFSIEQIEQISAIDVQASKMLKLATDFYDKFNELGSDEIVGYHADTQGVYDILHLLRGDELFYEMSDDNSRSKTHELLKIITALYIEVSKAIKEALGEESGEMTHGHGTQQGMYFPNAGVRLSEDTPTLLSPAMIDEFVLPYMRESAEPFGGAFVHYCGKHEYLYEKILECDFVRAIDLGNPEMYDTKWLLEKCSATGTVFYGRLAAVDGESWSDYIKRLAGILNETGARCVLRPEVFPLEKSECEDMLNMWHELTG
ncbi:MAG: hypothetical protein ACIAQZ_07620 [Sedimentisphaeraceae bacterium JB056]